MAKKTEKQEKAKALDRTLEQIEKQFGKGAIMRLSEDEANVDIGTIPTGTDEPTGR